MLRDMREELRSEKPASREMAAMPMPVDSTTLRLGKGLGSRGTWGGIVWDSSGEI